MKLFKLIASKAGRVVFDDRLEAASPREAREQMRTLLGLQSLTGVVYAVTEIPVELIESIVDARITHAMQRLNSGQPPESIDNLIRPTVGEEVRSQLANMREQIATASRAAPGIGGPCRTRVPPRSSHCGRERRERGLEGGEASLHADAQHQADRRSVRAVTQHREGTHSPGGLGPMSERLTITRYGSRYWAVWLDGQLLAVTLYKKGAQSVTAAITKLSTHHGKEVHHALQAA